MKTDAVMNADFGIRWTHLKDGSVSRDRTICIHLSRIKPSFGTGVRERNTIGLDCMIARQIRYGHRQFRILLYQPLPKSTSRHADQNAQHILQMDGQRAKVLYMENGLSWTDFGTPENGFVLNQSSFIGENAETSRQPSRRVCRG